ncbi:hypothetical protein [Longirhabdus pacifica]|uniref:hypothetical protein n=1 Tax=Longirhabdus pacifica TaxID=2305227 RepID=UPI001009118A|nr:hypothetical protein [Longirhabdus pacifica]
MYKKVNNNEMLKQFYEIKDACWTEAGYEIEHHEQSEKYLIYTNAGIAGGTCEFTPYEKMRDESKHVFKQAYDTYPSIFEVDGFAILPEQRGKLALIVMKLIVDYGEKHGLTHCVSLASEEVYYLVKKLNLMVDKVGENFIYKGGLTIPIGFDVQDVYSSKENRRYRWMRKTVAMK